VDKYMIALKWLLQYGLWSYSEVFSRLQFGRGICCVWETLCCLGIMRSGRLIASGAHAELLGTFFFFWQYVYTHNPTSIRRSSFSQSYTDKTTLIVLFLFYFF